MNTKRTLKWGLVTAAATCVVVAAVPGCELLVDFDRSKIPSEGGAEDVTTPPADGPTGEGGGGETSTDAPSEASEASTSDAPVTDGPQETSTTEGGTEGGPEGGHEGGMEAGPEGGDASDGAMGAAMFGISPATVDYGTVGTGETTAAYTFTVTNSGTASGTPTITKGGTNPGEFTASGCTSPVAASSSCTLSVTFAPGSNTGSQAATISVGTGASATVSGTGATAGTLTITPPSQGFGTVTVGSTSADVPLTVTNTDSVNAVTLGNPTIDGQDLSMFAVDADGGVNQCSGTLAAGGTCTVFVHFAPTGSAGSRYASLSITGTATDGGAAPGTASASLTGTAQ